MGDNDNLFDKLKDLSGKLPEKFNILEEQIDVKIQLDYFKYSEKLKKEQEDKTVILEELPDLHDKNITLQEKKDLLVILSGVDDPKAFRILEEYKKNAPEELKDWATLALQESKMLLESSLLEENQMFISTGLGGKNNMLRYCIVLIGEDELTDFHRKRISSEFEFYLNKASCKLESIEFENNYAVLMALIPFNVNFQEVLRTAIDECNQYGGFLQKNFLVTNVKKLSFEEVDEFIKTKKLPFSDETIMPDDDIVADDELPF